MKIETQKLLRRDIIEFVKSIKIKYNIVIEPDNILVMENLSPALLSAERIITVISKDSGINYKHIISKNRRRENVDVRFICIKIIKNYKNNWSLKKVSNIFNYAHHSSVIHAVKEADKLIETNKEFRNQYQRAVYLIENITNNIEKT